MALPRLLVIMGSGETSPTMTKVHRSLLARLGSAPVPAVVLDTPVGFQENADEVTARAVDYFRDSVGQELGVATYRSAEAADPVDYETALVRLRQARYVFAGPGSPSYALEQWRGSRVPDVLREKLRGGGCVTFASAAAVTVGQSAVPVYEIYKVGQAPHWLEGLDLLAEAGLSAAVIPHYNNAEGGTHDTRYCYLGERRLSLMEEQLPDGTFVLGVDEHTACIVDLDADTATVTGHGVVTVRRQGKSTELPDGVTVPLQQWREGAETAAGSKTASPVAAEREARAEEVEPAPFLADVDGSQRHFDDALASGDARGAVKAALDLEELMTEWAHETFSADERDRARSALRAMVTRLGETAEDGLRDPRQVLAPFVEALLEAREQARSEKRFDDADAIRDRLVATGIEVRDRPDGTDWELGGLA